MLHFQSNKANFLEEQASSHICETNKVQVSTSNHQTRVISLK